MSPVCASGAVTSPKTQTSTSLEPYVKPCPAVTFPWQGCATLGTGLTRLSLQRLFTPSCKSPAELPAPFALSRTRPAGLPTSTTPGTLLPPAAAASTRASMGEPAEAAALCRPARKALPQAALRSRFVGALWRFGESCDTSFVPALLRRHPMSEHRSRRGHVGCAWPACSGLRQDNQVGPACRAAWDAATGKQG